MKQTDWRNDPSITSKDIYIRKFAWLPVKLADGTRLFWKNYYKGFRCLYYRDRPFRNEFDIPGNISEDDYIIKKLLGQVHQIEELQGDT